MKTERMRERLAGLPGRIGFLARDTVTGEELRFGAEQPIEAASVIKLCVMAEAFRQREAGLLDFTREVEVRPEDCLPSCGALSYMHRDIRVQVADLVTLMIILSDNTATNLLIDMLGPENINAMISVCGLSATALRRKLFRPELARQGIRNTISAADMARLLSLMLEGKLVSPDASAEMLRILGNQRLNGKMPFHLHSRGIRCAHKTGEDDGITHDVGVIGTEHPVIFCFLSEQTDVPVAERALQDLAAWAAGLDV